MMKDSFAKYLLVTNYVTQGLGFSWIQEVILTWALLSGTSVQGWQPCAPLPQARVPVKGPSPDSSWFQ